MRILITGTTSGFGQLLVQEFLKRGDTVVATGRRLKERGEILAVVRATARPGTFFELDLDVTDPKQRADAVRFCNDQIGGLDILVNNAGYGVFGALEDLSEEQIRQQMEINFFGTVLMTQAFLPSLRATRGKVINFSSVLGLTTIPFSSMYCASKFAVEGLSESMAHELRIHGVQVCLVEPGSFATNFKKGVDWGIRSASAESPYNRQTKSYQLLHSERGIRAADPMVVVRGVANLAHRKNVPMRAPFGLDTLIARGLRRILPKQWYFLLSSRVFRLMFEKNL